MYKYSKKNCMEERINIIDIFVFEYCCRTMKIIPYSPEYQQSIAECFKRHFIAMKDMSLSEISEWMKPLLEYKWKDEVSDEEFPYKHGMLLVDEDNGNKVVGYYGHFCSHYYAEDKRFLYINNTTGAVDKEYRDYMSDMGKIQWEYGDVCSNFSAIPSIEKIILKFSYYKYIDHHIYRYAPIPSGRNGLKVQFVTKPEQISDGSVRTMYEDHLPYKVCCAIFRQGEMNCYVFFKKKTAQFKFIKKMPDVRVLHVTDKAFFTENLHAILWALQKRTLCFLAEFDSRTVDQEKCSYKPHNVWERSRLIRNIHHLPVPDVGDLYSELAILKDLH